jgi:hypothetical protein
LTLNCDTAFRIHISSKKQRSDGGTNSRADSCHQDVAGTGADTLTGSARHPLQWRRQDLSICKTLDQWRMGRKNGAQTSTKGKQMADFY